MSIKFAIGIASYVCGEGISYKGWIGHMNCTAHLLYAGSYICYIHEGMQVESFKGGHN